jgi:hypothetical protein
MRSTRLFGLVAICIVTALPLHRLIADEPAASGASAVQTVARQARQLLDQNDVANAILLLETHISTGQTDTEFLSALVDAYQQQLERFQHDGKVQQTARIWDKLAVLRSKHPDLPGQDKSLPNTVHQTQKTIEPVEENAAPNTLGRDADAAFAQGKYLDALRGYQQAQQRGEALSVVAKERFAYCKLYLVSQRLNATHGEPGEERAQLVSEVKAALELAPRLEFGEELRSRLQPNTPTTPKTTIRHLTEKQEGWQVSESTHFRAYHLDQNLAEQVLQVAEQTRAAVCRKWLNQDVSWSQPCQIYVHPTADSYHRQSGMPTTAPGHSDYDADRNDASNIHYRRVFVRADHPHMLTAILPHEITHVVLNGQVGRRLLPRWADEGMAVLSEPYSRIALHLDPLPQAYQSGRSLRLNDLLHVETYPADRSQVATFYGESVCLVEYLTTLHGAREFIAFMRDANEKGEEAALQQHYGMTVSQLDGKLQQWILQDHMPTLAGKN